MELHERLSGQHLIHASFLKIARLVKEFEKYYAECNNVTIPRKDVASVERLCNGLLELHPSLRIENHHHSQNSALRELARARGNKSEAKLTNNEIEAIGPIICNMFPRNITEKIVTIKEPHLRLLKRVEILSRPVLAQHYRFFITTPTDYRGEHSPPKNCPYYISSTDEAVLEDWLSAFILRLTPGMKGLKSSGDKVLPVSKPTPGPSHNTKPAGPSIVLPAAATGCSTATVSLTFALQP